MREALDNVNEGVQTGGELLKDVRFADNQRMVAKSRERTSSTHEPLSRNSNGVGHETAKEYDINTKKTKKMKVLKSNKGTVNITVEGQPVEQVKSIKYFCRGRVDRRWKMQ